MVRGPRKSRMFPSLCTVRYRRRTEQQRQGAKKRDAGLERGGMIRSREEPVPELIVPHIGAKSKCLKKEINFAQNYSNSKPVVRHNLNFDGCKSVTGPITRSHVCFDERESETG